MIYALKLLFAVLFVSGAATLVYRATFRELMTEQEYRRSWTLVIACMLASYLCKFPAVFLLALAGIGLWGNASFGNKPLGALCVYLVLAIVAPPISLQLGGVGGINSILDVDHFRLLALAVLAVPALRLASAKKTPGYGRLLALDLSVLAYPLLRIVLAIPYSTTTTTARSLVEAGLDVWLPYYVATRSIRTTTDLRLVAAHLLLALLFGASIGVFEELIQHNLFTGLEGVYGITWQLSYVLMRGGLIRVQAMTQQPIILAFAMVFGLGLWVWLRGGAWRKARGLLPLLALLGALVFTWSRGPWLGAMLLAFMFLVMRKLSGNGVRVLLVAGIAAGVILKAMNVDEQLADLINSFFGGNKDDLSTIAYRRELLDTSLALIKQSPMLGVPDYASQMQDLKQGQGIIDIVNTYIAVMLSAGVVGLACFVAPFVIVMQRMLGHLRRDESGAVTSEARFAVTMVATSVALLFIIFTTSLFGLMPLVLTLLVALPGAWLAMPASERDSNELKMVEEVHDPLERARRAGAIRPYIS